MTIGIAIVIALGALFFVFARLSSVRNRYQPDSEATEEPSRRRDRKTRRERKLEAYRAQDPLPEPKGIIEIMREEAEALGVYDTPGTEGVDTPVLLKVWHRDESVRATCDGELRFEVSEAVEAADAGVDEVRLVCAAVAATSPPTEMDSATKDDGDANITDEHEAK